MTGPDTGLFKAGPVNAIHHDVHDRRDIRSPCAQTQRGRPPPAGNKPAQQPQPWAAAARNSRRQAPERGRRPPGPGRRPRRAPAAPPEPEAHTPPWWAGALDRPLRSSPRPAPAGTPRQSRRRQPHLLIPSQPRPIRGHPHAPDSPKHLRARGLLPPGRMSF